MKYAVLFTTVASSVCYVDADDEDEARELADEQFEPPVLCASCSGWRPEDPNLELGGDWEQNEDDSGVWAVEQ